MVRMPFVLRAKLACCAVGLVSLGNLLCVRCLPVVEAAAQVKESDDEDACVYCHKAAVEGFARSKMARSMRFASARARR